MPTRLLLEGQGDEAALDVGFVVGAEHDGEGFDGSGGAGSEVGRRVQRERFEPVGYIVVDLRERPSSRLDRILSTTAPCDKSPSSSR
jgi:hypothetical protein